MKQRIQEDNFERIEEVKTEKGGLDSPIRCSEKRGAVREEKEEWRNKEREIIKAIDNDRER